MEEVLVVISHVVVAVEVVALVGTNLAVLDLVIFEVMILRRSGSSSGVGNAHFVHEVRAIWKSYTNDVDV